MTAKLLPLRGSRGQTDEMSDEALVAACAAAEPAALAALFDRHHASVHRFLARLAGVDAPVIDDLVQETFVLVFDEAGRYRAEAPVRGFLLGIAANVARRHVRAEVRRRARDAVFVASVSGHCADLVGEVEGRDLAGRVLRALRRLPHELREAFVLCDVEGLRGVDAARALGLREGTLYRRLHEARRGLRALLGGES